MTMINLLKKAALLLVLSIVLVSCATSFDSSVKNLQLGTTKADVIKKLGKDYQVVSMEQTDKGYAEVIRYAINPSKDKNVAPSYRYILYFLDEKLVKLGHEDVDQSVQPPLAR